MAKPQPKYLKDYRPPAYLVDHIDLTFDLFETHADVTATLQVRRSGDGAAPLLLDGESMELKAIALNGTAVPPAGYTLTDKGLTVAKVPAAFTLTIETRIKPQENTSLEGLYRSEGMFCTQCEANGFRKITYYPDRPDVMAKFSCTLIADRKKYPVLLANGNRVESGHLEDGRHQARWEDPFAKPAYLFALVAGDLTAIEDRYETASSRMVDLVLYVEKENADKCDHAMASLKRAMRWDEERFGREYDLSIYMIVAVNDFNMGAMENKGLNIFNSKFVLARPTTATDTDFLNIEAVIGHEYFHNWTGNRITLRDWFQLSLKEGLTVFRDQEFTADMTSAAVKRISDVRKLRAHQFPEDAGPMAHPVRPESYIEMNNFYTVTVYEKGAEVIRMIHTLLGEDGFRKGMDLYFERFDGQAVTCEDFVRTMEEAGGVDLARFRRWYSQAGTPAVTVKRTFDSKAGRYTLSFRQTLCDSLGQAKKKPMHIPVAVGLLDSSGKEIPLRLSGERQPCGTTRLLHLEEEESSFHFEGIFEEPVPSILRGFSAPVKLSTGASETELLFLWANDTDPFNRWEAGQQLFSRTLLAMVGDLSEGKVLFLDDKIVNAFRRTLTDPDLDNSLKSLFLTLPGETELSDMMPVIDTDGIHRAREFVIRKIAETLYQAFVAAYRDNHLPPEAGRDAVSIARRSLKNLALFYLGKSGRPEAETIVFEAFENATNMTDEMAAFGILAGMESGSRALAARRFHEKWKSDPLVMDKWFQVQAAARLPETLGNVRQLMDHPLFSIRNPNKVRALIGTFCGANPWCFHHDSGEGYRFLADRVIELNGLNPQIAARLAAPFNRWRRFDPARQALMKAQLERIIALPDICSDLYEIASRALA